jgi:hypothetical protein
MPPMCFFYKLVHGPLQYALQGRHLHLCVFSGKQARKYRLAPGEAGMSGVGLAGLLPPPLFLHSSVVLSVVQN